MIEVSQRVGAQELLLFAKSLFFLPTLRRETCCIFSSQMDAVFFQLVEIRQGTPVTFTMLSTKEISGTPGGLSIS